MGLQGLKLVFKGFFLIAGFQKLDFRANFLFPQPLTLGIYGAGQLQLRLHLRDTSLNNRGIQGNQKIPGSYNVSFTHMDPLDLPIQLRADEGFFHRFHRSVHKDKVFKRLGLQRFCHHGNTTIGPSGDLFLKLVFQRMNLHFQSGDGFPFRLDPFFDFIGTIRISAAPDHGQSRDCQSNSQYFFPVFHCFTPLSRPQIRLRDFSNSSFAFNKSTTALVSRVSAVRY